MFAETVCDNFVPTIPALCCRTGGRGQRHGRADPRSHPRTRAHPNRRQLRSVQGRDVVGVVHEIFGIIAGVLVALRHCLGIAAFALDSEDVSTAFVVRLIVAVLLTTSNALNTVVAARLRNNSEVQIFEDDDSGPSLAFIIVAGIAVAMSFLKIVLLVFEAVAPTGTFKVSGGDTEMQSWDLARLFDQVERTVSTAGFAMIFVALHSFADATSKGADLPPVNNSAASLVAVGISGNALVSTFAMPLVCDGVAVLDLTTVLLSATAVAFLVAALLTPTIQAGDVVKDSTGDVLKVSVILSGVVMCWINFFDRAKGETAVAGVGILFALLAAVGATLTRSEINDWGRYSNDMSDAALALEYAMIVLYVSVALKDCVHGNGNNAAARARETFL